MDDDREVLEAAVEALAARNDARYRLLPDQPRWGTQRAVMHLNGDPRDNRLENLRLVDPRENSRGAQ